MRRFFGIKNGENILIENDEFAHLTKVLRKKVGDKIVCICDDNFDYFCEIIKIDKKFCVAKIENVNSCKALPKKEITLIQALPKKEYIDEIVFKSVECGVSNLQFFISKFSNTKTVNLNRITNQIISASKQCQRSKFMQCKNLINFNQMLDLLKDYDIIVFANEKEEKKSIFDLPSLTNANKIAVIVGNEGGFSEEEIESIISKNAQSITLGSRILRCPTAVVAILSLINAVTKN